MKEQTFERHQSQCLTHSRNESSVRISGDEDQGLPNAQDISIILQYLPVPNLGYSRLYLETVSNL